jgi:hypothetical protein
MLFTGKWMELENIMLNEMSQSQKVKDHDFPHMWKLDHKLNVAINTYIMYI